MKETSDGSALDAWNPKVARSCVKNDFEILRRITETNFGEILSIHEVAQGNAMTAFELLLCIEESLAVLGSWAPYLTTPTTGAHKGHLDLSRCAILLSKPSTLELRIARDGSKFMEFKFVDLCVCGKRQEAYYDWEKGE